MFLSFPMGENHTTEKVAGSEQTVPPRPSGQPTPRAHRLAVLCLRETLLPTCLCQALGHLSLAVLPSPCFLRSSVNVAMTRDCEAPDAKEVD